MPFCLIFLLKRRSALSKVSPSRTLTYDTFGYSPPLAGWGRTKMNPTQASRVYPVCGRRAWARRLTVTSGGSVPPEPDAGGHLDVLGQLGAPGKHQVEDHLLDRPEDVHDLGDLDLPPRHGLGDGAQRNLVIRALDDPDGDLKEL